MHTAENTSLFVLLFFLPYFSGAVAVFLSQTQYPGKMNLNPEMVVCKGCCPAEP